MENLDRKLAYGPSFPVPSCLPILFLLSHPSLTALQHSCKGGLLKCPSFALRSFLLTFFSFSWLQAYYPPPQEKTDGGGKSSVIEMKSD